MAYAERLNPKGIFILSAKYGLLNPNDIIEPYEHTLKAMKAGERRAWTKGVIEELRRHSDLYADHFVLLAGTAYRQKSHSLFEALFSPDGRASAW
jgi:cytoplasmic iron level regulating protein YaaA (DUF328/UPF0246 family)